MPPDVSVHFRYEDAIEDPEVGMTSGRKPNQRCSLCILDVVYVALCNNLHMKVVMYAIEHGKHCICEKPLGKTCARF